MCARMGRETLKRRSFAGKVHRNPDAVPHHLSVSIKPGASSKLGNKPVKSSKDRTTRKKSLKMGMRSMITGAIVGPMALYSVLMGHNLCRMFLSTKEPLKLKEFPKGTDMKKVIHKQWEKEMLSFN